MGICSCSELAGVGEPWKRLPSYQSDLVALTGFLITELSGACPCSHAARHAQSNGVHYQVEDRWKRPTHGLSSVSLFGDHDAWYR